MSRNYLSNKKQTFIKGVTWESPAITVSHDFLETLDLKAKAILIMWAGGRVLSCSFALLIIHRSAFTAQIIDEEDPK